MPGIDYSKRYRDYARFTPAISEMYTRFVTNENPKRPCPIPQQDLNYLDPNSALFHLSHTLYSAGQAAKSDGAAAKTEMVGDRDRSVTTVLGDSGGFQIQMGSIKFKGDETRNRMMRWMENNCDWSMILDFPTGGINMGTIDPHTARLMADAGAVDPKTGKLIVDSGNKAALEALCLENGQSLAYNTCLLQTLINNDWFVKNRKPGATKFLNVVQGRNPSESKIWYEKVKHYPFEGWSLAGPHKENFEMTLSRIIEMRDENLLQDKDWMHFLGVGKLQHGCAYTTIQRNVREHINPNFTISYDESSPFTLAAYGKLFLGYTLDKRRWGITGEKFDDREYLAFPHALSGNPELIDVPGSRSNLPFLDEVRALWETKLKEETHGLVLHDDLWDSNSIKIADEIKNNSRFVETEIGKRLKMSDVCVNVDEKFTSTWDVVTYAMMMNHNVQVHLEAVFESQDLYDRGDTSRVPADLLELKEVINELFVTENPMDFIRKNAKILNCLAGDAAEGGVMVTEDFDFTNTRVFLSEKDKQKEEAAKLLSTEPTEVVTDLFVLPAKEVDRVEENRQKASDKSKARKNKTADEAAA
jgi:hypothetical protein